MNLLYKDDWEQTKQHYLAWWAHEAMDRCAIAVTAPRADADINEPWPTPPSDPVERWTDLNYITELNEHIFRRTFHGGEAVPSWNGGYPGHTAIPAYLGCPTNLDTRTGWWEPIMMKDDLDFSELKLDRQGKWWEFTIKLLKLAAKESKGKTIPSIGAFGGCGDTLAALRGTDRLLFDVVDRPEQVLAIEEYLMDMWFEVYDVFYAIIHDAAEGSSCWFNLWSPGKFYSAQNDFSYMISPDMFRRLSLPVIKRQTEFLDHSIYHVDGVGAFAHVPALCELPRLQALQILPGAGKPSPLHYMDTLKHVQHAGKNLHISIGCEEVETALSKLSARGLFISTSCPTEQEARDLLENAKKWSKDRKV